MGLPVRIGMDTAKSVFQLHGVNENEVAVLRRQMRRAKMIRYFEKLPSALVAIESCGSSHHWARLLQSFGHEVRLLPPQYVKPYVKRGKNDAADAEALCEAVNYATGPISAGSPRVELEIEILFRSGHAGIADPHGRRVIAEAG